MVAPKNVYDVLKERGFVKQVVDEEEIRQLLATESLSCYIGFDPTADSLHAGSLMPIMALLHMQLHGHHPIALLGGGTALVGDPSGKTEMRQMLTKETINSNAENLKQQLSIYLDFKNNKASLVNNADWLCDLNYIEFLRDIGRHFSVNKMLTAESYRIRLETGLSFIEFNYQLLQAYDYLMLYRSHNCVLQMGGDDQWGNIIAGADLVRRLESKKAYAITFPLLTTATGQKMGKTAKGALWLDPGRTSPYEFYQYWINVDDRDVKKFLAYFTLLPMDEVERLGQLQDNAIKEAKEVLAYEATKITHGEEEAQKSRNASRSIFGGTGVDLSGMPSATMSIERFKKGIGIIDLLTEVGLAPSKSEARRLIQQGGCYINDTRIDDQSTLINQMFFVDNNIILRSGKKKYFRIIVEKN
jgi:tyrosyl-tRNA synthetase